MSDSCTQTRLSVLRDSDDVTQDKRHSTTLSGIPRPVRLLPSTSSQSRDSRSSRIPRAVASGTRPDTNALSSTTPRRRLPQPGGSTGLPTRSRSVLLKNGTPGGSTSGYPRFVGTRCVHSASPLDRPLGPQRRPQGDRGCECASTVESDIESGYGDTLPATSTELIAISDEVTPADIDAEDISGQPVQLVVLNESVSSHGDVLAAMLEADLSMQEMMSSGDTDVCRHSDTSPVRVMVTRNNSLPDDDSPLTDSAKRALRKTPLRQSSPVTRRLPPEHSLTRVNISVDDRTYDGSSVGHLHRSDTMWMSDDVGNVSSGTVRRQVEVVQHDITQSTHVLQPNTRLFSDDDDDDTMSWPSGMTEPDPEATFVSRKTWGTQTPRHRTTQTPEDAQTQTPHDRRRKLPSLPGQSSRSSLDLGDLASDDASVMSGDSNDSTRMQIDTQAGSATGPMSARQMVKRRKLPGFQSEPLNRNDEPVRHDTDHTSSTLMHTMHYAQTDSPRSCTNNSPLLRTTKERTAQPAYLKEYQEYIESFDGTTTEPFASDSCHGDTLGNGHKMAATSMKQNKRPESSNRVLESGMRSRVIGSEVSSNPNISKVTRGQRSTSGERSVPPSSTRRVQSARAGTRRPPQNSELRVQAGRERSLTWHSKEHIRNGISHDDTAQMVSTTAATQTRNARSDGSHRTAHRRVKTQDFSQQTPCHHATQTPLKLRFCVDGVSVPRGTTSLGDTFVIDPNDSLSSPVIQPWQLIGRDDLDIQSSRDFATQTFGQSYQQSHSHIETQTNELGLVTSVPRYSHILDDSTQTTTNEQTQTRVETVEPQPHVDIPPIKITRSSVHEEPTRDVETQRDIFDMSKAKKGKKKREHRRHDTTDAVSQSATVQSNMTKMDILKFMLKQVRDLKSQINPAENGSSGKEETKKKHKSKGKHKHRRKSDVSDSVVDSFDGEREKLYTKRRLELMYKKPDEVVAMVSDPESRHHHRRRHSVDSYLSERLDRDRRDYDELRSRYIPRSRVGYPQGRREHSSSPLRRGVPPSVSHGRLYERPAYKPMYPVVGVSPSRKYQPQPQFRTMYPPPAPLPAPLTPRVPRMTPVVPPPPAPPQYAVPTTAGATQLQLGQGAFRPISDTEAQQMGTPMQQNASIVFIPNTQQQSQGGAAVAQSPYIVIASPYRYDSVSDSPQDGKENAHRAVKKRDHKPRPSSARLVETAQLDSSILKATRAANEMKELTRRLKHK